MRIEPHQSPDLRNIHHVSRPAGNVASSAAGRLPSGYEAVEFPHLESLLGRLAELPENRHMLLAAVRQRLAQGYYDLSRTAQRAAQELVEDLDWLAGLPLHSSSPLND